MAFERINLREKLEKTRDKEVSEKEILEQFKSLLETGKNQEEQILQRLQQGNPENLTEGNDFDFDLLETNRIFHISHIETICINYRLRFLSSKYFKGELPQEALMETKALEKQHQTTLTGFKIMAPAKLFKLKNADDPILFAPMGNQYYYLIHKWGNDLHPLRKLLMWPFKNMENLLIFAIVFSFLSTFVIREIFFSRYQETSQFIMLFFFTFKAVAGLLVFYGIGLGKNFSSAIWRSKYYNA